MKHRRALGWVVLAVVAAVALSIGAFGSRDDRSPGERALGLADGLACLRCEGQSVADSNSEFAKVVRAEINRRISAGQTDGEITSALTATYGDQISLRPKSTGVDALIWIAPVVALVTALAGLAFVFRNWSRRGAAPDLSDTDRVLVERARRHGATGT